MSKLKQYYEEAGYDVGKKDYIDNCEIQAILTPVIRMLIAKRLEAEKQGRDTEAMTYISVYMEIWLDMGMSFTDMKNLFEREEKTINQKETDKPI